VSLNRDRFRTDERAIGYSQYQYYRNGVWTDSSYVYPTKTFSYYRRIFDVSSQKKAPRVIHPVSSYKIVGLTPMETQQYSSSDGTIYRAKPGTSWPIHQDRETLVAHFVDYANTILYQTAVNNAFTAFYSQMPEVVSIANFLYELKDIRTLLPKIESTLAKTVSGGFLNLNFGWLPLVSDLKKLGTLAQTFSQRLNFLKETYGREVRMGYSEKFGYPTALPTTRTYNSPYTDQATRYTLDDYNAVFRANGYLYHELEGLDDASRLFSAFRAELGLNNPAKVIWTAIPFSFVVDWFARIGSYLDRLAEQPFEGVWEARRVTNSLSEYYHVTVYQYFFPSYNSQPVKVGEYVMERYNRHIGLPVGVATTLLSLDPKKQLLAGALIHQRLD